MVALRLARDGQMARYGEHVAMRPARDGQLALYREHVAMRLTRDRQLSPYGKHGSNEACNGWATSSIWRTCSHAAYYRDGQLALYREHV